MSSPTKKNTSKNTKNNTRKSNTTVNATPRPLSNASSGATRSGTPNGTRRNSPVTRVNSSNPRSNNIMITALSRPSVCPRYNRNTVADQVRNASKKYSIRSILTTFVSILIFLSTIQKAGWLTKTRTTTLHGITKLQINLECYRLQRQAQKNIESLHFWKLQQNIDLYKALQISRNAIIKSPLKVAENILVSVTGASELLLSASKSANNLGNFVQNVTGYLGDYTGTVLGLSLASMLLILISVQQQICLPWTGFKKLIQCMVSMVSKIPIDKIYKITRYGVTETSGVIVRLIKEAKKFRNVSTPATRSPSPPTSSYRGSRA